MSEEQPGTAAEREYDLDRTITFSDGVFAIAITLLVLPLIDLPHGEGTISHRLWDQRDDYLSFAISFAVIAKFWLGHHRMYGYLSYIDGRMISLNLFYLAMVVLVPFSTAVLGAQGGQAVAVIIYALNLAVLGIISSLMWLHASNAGLYRLRQSDETNRLLLRLTFVPWIIFLLSAPVALVSTTAAELSWLLIFLVQPPVMAQIRRRDRERHIT